MSDIEDAIFVERMADMEAEPFEQGSSDLLDFSDTPVPENEVFPVSSTTDQLLDFMKPETSDGDNVATNTGLDDFVSSVASESEQQETQQQETQQDPEPAEETVSSSAVEELPTTPVAASPSVDEQQQEEKPSDIEQDSKQELTSCMAKCLMHYNVDQRVIDLIYWKCWKKTAAVFVGIMFILLSLTCCTLLSVVTLFSMALLAVAFLYRIGMTVFNAVQKTSADHPFKHLLEEDLQLSEESVQKLAKVVRQGINARVNKLQKLFFIEDVIESVKFGVMLWLVSYIASWFSLLTIAIIVCIDIFTFPVLYERNQEQVDKVLAIVKSKAKAIFSTIQEKLPAKLKFGKAKEE